MLRMLEMEMLRMLISRKNRLSRYQELLQEKYNVTMDEQVEQSVFRNLRNEFPKEEERRKYTDCILIEKNADGSYSLSTQFQQELLNKDFKEMVLELLDFGIEQWKEKYKEIYKDTNFRLYQKYTYEDVCRLLNWNKNSITMTATRKRFRYLLIIIKRKMQLLMKIVLYQRAI